MAATKRRSERPESADGHDSQVAFVLRVLRSLGRRCAEGDDAALEALLEVERTLPGIVSSAGADLHATGMSWGQIAQITGSSRQAAHERFGGKA